MRTQDEVQHHVQAITKAGLCLLGTPGGFISSLLSDYLPDAHRKRLEDFARELSHRIDRVERRMEEEAFAFIVEKAARVAVSDHRAFKRKLLAQILADACESGAKVSEERHLIDVVDRLEEHHAAVLKLVTTRREAARGTEENYWVPYDELERHFVSQGVCDEATKRVWVGNALEDLLQFGLLNAQMTSDQRNRIIMGVNPRGLLRMQEYCLTKLGHRFVRSLRASE